MRYGLSKGKERGEKKMRLALGENAACILKKASCISRKASRILRGRKKFFRARRGEQGAFRGGWQEAVGREGKIIKEERKAPPLLV